MGILSGAITFRRFRVLGELPSDFRDRYLAGIGKHLFRENDRARTKDDNVGWVNASDASDIELDLNKFLHNQFLVLALRIDRKRVPARYFKVQMEKRYREVMAAKGVERLGLAHKRELKEAMEEELLSRALPAVTVCDMAWDIHKQEVWLFTTVDAAVDHFRNLFKATFGLEVKPMHLSDWVGAADAAELTAQVASLEPTGFRA